MVSVAVLSVFVEYFLRGSESIFMASVIGIGGMVSSVS
jgi:hypothetical protein